MPSMKRKRLAVFYDLSKAFDKVWREGLLLKVPQADVSGRMHKWIRCFLHDKSARVKVDGHLSDSVMMREGVPQGVLFCQQSSSYISPTSPVLSQDMSPTASMQTSAAYTIQDVANKVHTWTQDWGLQINQVKTQSTVFSLSTTKEQVKIKLGDIILPQAETPIFLGATLDYRLSWKPHIESMRASKN